MSTFILQVHAVLTYRALFFGGAKGTRPPLRTRPGRGSASPLGCHSLPRPFEPPPAAAKKEKRAVSTYRALCLGGAKGTRPRLRTRPGRGSGSPPGCHSLPRPFESPLAAAKKRKARGPNILHLSSKSRHRKSKFKGSPVRSCTEEGFCNPRRRQGDGD